MKEDNNFIYEYFIKYFKELWNDINDLILHNQDKIEFKDNQLKAISFVINNKLLREYYPFSVNLHFNQYYPTIDTLANNVLEETYKKYIMSLSTNDIESICNIFSDNYNYALVFTGDKLYIIHGGDELNE